MKLAALSIDLDEIDCYQRIHGLGDTSSETRGHGPVYTRAVPRFAELFDQLNVPCTFFAIGQDLHGPAAQALRSLVAQDHEAANHSQNHHYDLTRRDADVMRSEVDECSDAIERACGVRPVGFRAPGYTVNDTLLAVLRAAGMLYDSSVFPCPPYWLAKATAMGLIRLRGRESRSVLDTPRVLTAPADPYIPAAPYWARSRPNATDALLELPIGVTQGLRLPFIGTSLMLAGPLGARALTHMISSRSFVNLELHGIDFLGAEEDGLQALARHQQDLRVSVERKTRTLRSVIELLKSKGFQFVTLQQAARSVTAT